MSKVMLRRSVFLSALLVLGISGLHGAGLLFSAKPAPANPATAQARCGALKTQCTETTQCCDGLVCNTSLPHAGPATCVAKLATGASCTADEQCVQGLLCLRKAVSQNASEPGTCGSPLALGAACTESTQCESENCADGKCATGYCEKKGVTCHLGGRCCRGLICTAPPQSYAPGICSEPFAKGTYCLSAEHCASHKCTNNKCE